MAQKRATCYILNVSSSMKKQPNDAFQKSLNIVVHRIEDKVLSKRKTDIVTVLLAGTPETENILAESEGGYGHIKELAPLSQPLIPLLRNLINVTTTDDEAIKTDVVDALIVAIFMIDQKCKKLKYIKHIMLITDSTQEIDWRDFDEIQNMLTTNNIGLTVVGVDLNESTKNNTNYRQWKALTDSISDGVVLTLDEAMEEVNSFHNKDIRPTPVYNGFLYLNNTPFNDHNFAAISCRMYLRTADNKKPQTPRKYSALSNGPTHSVAVETRYVLAPERNPHIKDMDDEIEVTTHDLEKGYRFGKTIVKVSSDETEYAKFKSKKELTILGFIPVDAIPRDLYFTRVHVVTAGEIQNEESACAISALAHALFEKRVAALARWVQKEDQAPKVGVLLPYFEPDIAVLHFSQLPFASDVRYYQFKSEPTINKNDPNNQEAERLMDEYIDKLDIGNIQVKDEHDPATTRTFEHLIPEGTFNPTIYMIDEAIKKRGLNEFAPLPDLDPRLRRNIEMLPEHQEIAKEYGKKLQDIYQVKEVQKKKKGTGYRNGNTEQALPSVGEVLGENQPAEEEENDYMTGILRNDVRKIGMADPLADFKAMVENPEEDLVESAVKQLGDIIVGMVMDSFGDIYTPKVISYIKEMRKTAAEQDEATTFNNTLQKLKEWYNSNKETFSCYSFWKQLKEAGITLISKDETKDKSVQHLTREDALKFLEDEAEASNTNVDTGNDNLGLMADDLLDDF